MVIAVMLFLILGLLVVLHEAGHLIAARAFNVPVKEFSVGFGPTLFKYKGKITTYNLKLCFFGGSCNIAEEDMERLSPGKKIMLYLAGPAMNGVITIIATAAAILASGNRSFSALVKGLYLMLCMPVFVARELIGSSVYDMGGIAMASSETGLQTLLAKNPVSVIFLLIAAFSMTLVALNILPLPPLDGGEALCVVLAHFFGNNRKVHRIVAITVWSILITVNLIAVLNDTRYIFERIVGW